MTQAEHAHVVELHTKAAYAHTAAARIHSSGDHASAQELARKALKCSLEANRYAEKIDKEPLLLA